uniref:B- and T-lymphocyte attenuator-like n=1 Tax=Seriola dumerili TaxID=41447 RepID=A0A3B4TM01_SERDU
MTGGVPVMRPNRYWTVLNVSILALLVLALNADSEDCETVIKVQRNTLYEAFVGQEFTMNCTVSFCNSSPPSVSWHKVDQPIDPVNVSSGSHIKTEWKELSHSEGTSYLIFQKILVSDSGLYQCRGGDGVSHNINVSVHGSPTPTPQLPENILMYVYPAAGIVTLVVIVIVLSIISMRGCKGKTKKETQTENQYMAVPMVEQPFPHASLQASPRQSPSAPPSRRSTRRSTRRNAPSSQPNEAPRDNEHVYGEVKEDTERGRNVVEDEGSSVVYAALNHQPPPGAAAPRQWRREEEFSEYAAIRVS